MSKVLSKDMSDVLFFNLYNFTEKILKVTYIRYCGDLRVRHYDALTALSAAAVAVLVWRPLSLYDGGFWLSFGAVLAVLAAVPVIQEETSVYTLHNNGLQVGTRMQQSSLKQNKKDGPWPVYLRRFWEYVRQVIL